MINVTRDRACDHIELFAKEGRLIQHEWHTIDNQGREVACLLGAIHPDINAPNDCPSNVMPQWIAELLIMLFDRVPADKAIDYGLRFAGALRHGYTDDSVMRRFLARVVDDAVDSAKPKGDAPDYWPMVESACDGVCKALLGGASRVDLDTVQAAAWAAQTAAWAAADSAAWVTADSAAWGAADSAAWAARAAAWVAADAAADAAWAAGAAVDAAAWAAARAAAYERMFGFLIEEMLRP